MRMRHLICLCLLLSLSCQDEDTQTVCDTTDPVKNMGWLRNLTKYIQENPDDFFAVSITAYEYNGQSVFNVYDLVSSCAFCDLRDCFGNEFVPEDFNDFMANKTNERKIWCQKPELCL